MAYFSEDFIRFLRSLMKNNNREWFHAHKREYETHVKEPFRALVAELIDRVSLLHPDVAIEPKDAIFRIARDIRFSKDKTPYKTFVAAFISRDGRQQMKHPGLYIQLGVEGLLVAGGMYQPAREDISRVRRAILEDGATFQRALRGKRFKDLFGELQGERNKRLPKEFAAAVARYPFIANKQFYYYAEYDDARIVLRDDLADFLMRHFSAGNKVNDFLKAAISRR
ncbi:MAG: DUF2461 domain-containing protein [Gemmatimonadota bacterium]|nr:MAG: DUF2461 domain-containing protein [Gemmatimonadota bacterium]